MTNFNWRVQVRVTGKRDGWSSILADTPTFELPQQCAIWRYLVIRGAGRALRTWIADEHSVDEIEHRFAKWRVITGSPWILVTGHDFSSYQSWGWMALINTAATYVASDGNSYPSLPRPVDAAHATMSDYRTWAAGEVCGYVVKAPNGDDIESVWGFYDDDDALEQAKTVAEYDALDRLDSANLAGAGFIGIV